MADSGTTVRRLPPTVHPAPMPSRNELLSRVGPIAHGPSNRAPRSISRSTQKHSAGDASETLLGVAVVAAASWGAWKVGKKLLGLVGNTQPSGSSDIEVSEAASTVTMGLNDVAVIDFVLSSPDADLWSQRAQERLRRAIQATLTETLGADVGFLVVATPGSLHGRVIVWFRSAWDTTTGKRSTRENASAVKNISAPRVADRVRSAVADALRITVRASDAFARLVRNAATIRHAVHRALEWFGDGGSTVIATDAGSAISPPSGFGIFS